MIKIFIKGDEVYSNPLEYILKIFSRNISKPLEFVKIKSDAQLIFDHTDSSSEPVNTIFFKKLLIKQETNYENHFKDKPYIFFSDNNTIDWLGTAFYMINSFQEYDTDSFDKNKYDQFGRFKFEKSYQYKYNCIDKNIVQECFENFAKSHKLFSEHLVKKKHARVFLSHDIDTINGSFFQDGLWAIKKGRMDVVFRLVMNEILSKPGWTNMDKIVSLHSDYNLKSTFFWLATKKVGENKIKNADYSIGKLNKIVAKTISNGLHKSAADHTLNEELELLPFSTKLNRYHFLKFTLPAGYNDLESSNIKFDASLGYAERYGFRNNYGLPFRPYNVSSKKPYSFVEVPLNIMDGTFHRDMKIPLKETSKEIINFIEMNKTNSIISILWHNTYFTYHKYEGYLEEYIKVLMYLKESGIVSVTPEEIINEFDNER